MAILNKTTLTIKEFIENGKLHEYSIEVDAIIKKIVNQNCKVSCHYLPKKSWFSFEPSGPIIRIEMTQRTVPVHIILDILHEYGHFLSGIPETSKPNIRREILAWDWALKELNLYPKLFTQIASFVKYREECLESYRK